ncbi:MAG: serine/threonine protein kinase, partial [Gemmataceae bacterium]|nr:serine/threonine protein kinase [Gemmataceae bacterium]
MTAARDPASVFADVIDLPADERAAFLDSACGGDAAVRAEVEVLLAAHARAGGWLAGGRSGDTTAPERATHDWDADPTGDAPPAPPPTLPGYDLLERVGAGGMGAVYRAIQRGLNRTVAVKLVLGGAAADPRQLVRFRAEAEAVAAVRHPHVVQVHECGEAGGQPFLVMELCPGGRLGDRLAAGRLAPPEAAGLLAKVAAGVAAAHAEGIVHRDLKPASVLFDAAGEPKVADFGLAKRAAGGDLTATRAVFGTPAYMAPEQARGDAKFVGPAADVWALGAILYECLAGRRPFDATDTFTVLKQVIEADPPRLRAAAPGVPRDLELVVLKCLRKEPHERYATAAELAADLRRFLDGRPVAARPVPAPGAAWKWAKRNRAVAASLLLAAVGLVGGPAAATWQAVRATA